MKRLRDILELLATLLWTGFEVFILGRHRPNPKTETQAET